MGTFKINITPYVQHTKEFIKHCAKEIVVALVLAIVAAVALEIMLDWYREKSADAILDSNSSAIAVITTYNEKGEPLSHGSVDEKKDIALLQFDAKDTPYVRLGNDSNKIKSGQKVVAIGAPLGLENTVSEGIISRAWRYARSITRR